MVHPLERIRAESRGRLLWIFGVCTLLLGAAIGYFGAGLKTPAGSSGELGLQLAGDPVVVSWIVSPWSPAERALAQNLLVLDYTFLVCYAMVLGLVCVWASTLWPRRLAWLGYWMPWAPWLAAVLDAVENTALLTVLRPTLDLNADVVPSPFALTLGWFCSWGKWTAIEVSLLYVAVAVGYASLAHLRGRLPAGAGR